MSKHERTPAPPLNRKNAPDHIPRDIDGRPDLGRLTRRYGSYARIPREAWHAFEQAMHDWNRRHKR